MNQRPQTLAQTVEIACLSKEVFNEQFGSLQRKDKRKGASGSGSGNNNNRKGVLNQTQSNPKAERASGKRKAEGDQQGGRDKLVCSTCKRRHGGECWNKQLKCFVVDSWDTLRKIAQ